MSAQTHPLGLDARLPAGDARQQLEELARERPEWRDWLRFYEAALTVAGEADWGAVAESVELHSDRAPGTPLLTGATVTLPAGAAGRLLGRLLATAGLEGAHLDPVTLLEAAINQDTTQVEAIAAGVGIDEHVLGVVADLAASAPLRACCRRYGATATAGWDEGFCPVCGAWPALAEQRGLERARHLRCGRCGADWSTVAFQCVFCGESKHDQLGSLVPEGGGEARRVETCDRCRGYLKTIAALRPAAGDAVPLLDLATVELDLAAVDRGFARPAAPAVDLTVRLVERRTGTAVESSS